MSPKIAVLLGALAVAGLASAASSSLAPEGRLRVSMDAPELFVLGEKFGVEVELLATGGDVEVEAWRLTLASFEVDGKALSARSDKHKITLAQGDTIELHFDLGKRIDRLSRFTLACDGSDANPIDVMALEPASKELDFMSIPAEDLGKYRIYMRTSRGDMLHEMWPHLAPNHVRNFLDLSHTGFYDGVIFHRTGAGFMIQGGDPTGTGSGSGPRKLKAEFSKEAHVRGVLSMARGGHSVDSASSQFFVMHGTAPGLDGQYSIFGKMMIGYDTLDAIVTEPGKPGRDGTIRPFVDQAIERAIVVLANQDKK